MLFKNGNEYAKSAVLCGDSEEVLKQYPDNSIDCMVTDPPYGYGFMGLEFDKDVPVSPLWRECLRVLKPGAFAFIMSAPRQDVLGRMIVNLTDAGFKTDFTSLYWTYASGFPKAGNIGKRTEKEELQGAYAGFQPKPAVEVILVCMKPLSEKTYVDQAMKNGKGVTWLDDARIPTSEEYAINTFDNGAKPFGGAVGEKYTGRKETSGRFPANLICSDDVLNDGVERKAGVAVRRNVGHSKGGNVHYAEGSKDAEMRTDVGYGDSGSYSRYFDLDKWANQLPFLITPKASKREKNEGLDGFETKKTNDGRAKEIDNAFQRGSTLRANNHPTCKPLKLMSYLITLGSRPGDTILEPFMGSGTTCLAAKNLGREFIGIEREEEYFKIAEARLNAVPDSLL